jgi:hypothetical protein
VEKRRLLTKKVAEEEEEDFGFSLAKEKMRKTMCCGEWRNCEEPFPFLH